MLSKKTQQQMDFIRAQRARIDLGFKELRKLHAESAKKHKRLAEALIAVEAKWRNLDRRKKRKRRGHANPGEPAAQE